MPIELAFASPRKLPKPKELKGRVVVLDVAFASEASGGGFDKITRPFLEGLGPRLAAWVDHHDHVLHERYAADPRFVLATKAQHGACPEMITPALVERIGQVDTVVCHTDFDGLCSAAKWLRGGIEPYDGADADARAIDTRIGRPGPLGTRLDSAIRARTRDFALFGIIVRHLASGLSDASLWAPIDAAAVEGRALEDGARRLAEKFRRVELTPAKANADTRGTQHLAYVDATDAHGRYDKTALLLLGQERAPIAVVVDRDTVTFAAAFDSGINFLTAFGLSGGMPTIVSIATGKLREAFLALGASESELRALGL
jgi:hypothetical protein